MNERHVVHLVPALETGGMEQLVSELAVRRGCGQTSVVCLRQPGQLGQQLIDDGYPVWFLDQPKSTWQLIHRLRRRLKDLPATVLHCHNWQAFTFGALATPFSKIGRLVVTKHGTVMPQDDTWGGRICRWAARRARLVGVSPEVQHLLARWFQLPSEQVAMVPNGLDLSRFSENGNCSEVRSNLDIPNDAFVLTCVARLANEKDHATLLRAFGRVTREIPAARLMIVGDGPLRNELQQQSSSDGISEKVHWLGNRSDVPDLLAASDLKVLSSVTEGMPMTLLEAMAAGLPVVASDVGGIPDVVEDGTTGKLVPPEQPSLLAQSIIDLARQPSRRQAMGRAGRARVENKFRLEKTLEAYEQIYLGNDAD